MDRDNEGFQRVENEKVIVSQPTHDYPLRSRQGEHVINTILDTKNGMQLEYRHLIKDPTAKTTWELSFCNELGRLSGGFGNNIKGTNTISFIPYQDIPQDRRGNITYGKIVVDYRPQKDENKLQV